MTELKNAELKNISNELQEDIYPMPIFCTLTVDNVQDSTNWYNKALNFRAIFSMNEPITRELTFVHLRRKKYQDILLVKGKVDKMNNASGISVTFQAWEDIDSLTENIRKNGGRIVMEPHNTLWNTRDVTLQDNDGYLITFTYPNQAVIDSIDDAQMLTSESWEQ